MSPGRPPGPTALLVGGMHRSGTSAVAGSLRLLGAALGENFVAAEASNVKGHWEHRASARLDEEILRVMGRSWQDTRPLPADWRSIANESGLADKLAEEVRRDFADRPLWAIKDPRISRLLPLWLDLTRQMQARPVAVMCWRHPLSVCASLTRRNGFSQERGLLLWLRHTLEMERHTRGLERCFVLFDDVLRDWRAVFAGLDRQLGISLSYDGAGAVDEFLSRELCHWSNDGGETLAGPIARLAERLTQGLATQAITDGAELRDRFDEVFASLAEFDRQMESDSPPPAPDFVRLWHEDARAEQSLQRSNLLGWVRASLDRECERDAAEQAANFWELENKARLAELAQAAAARTTAEQAANFWELENKARLAELAQAAAARTTAERASEHWRTACQTIEGEKGILQQLLEECRHNFNLQIQAFGTAEAAVAHWKNEADQSATANAALEKAVSFWSEEAATLSKAFQRAENAAAYWRKQALCGQEEEASTGGKIDGVEGLGEGPHEHGEGEDGQDQLVGDPAAKPVP